jgi:arabinan endo-1,5-alpha-L-arabinosidase
MAFGSFWSGIKLVELDAATGRRRTPDSPLHAVAWKNEIEAPCLIRRGDMYYLFVNWGLCCKGVDSTYNIRVGRSSSIKGPYVDSRGIDLLRGGGDDVLGTQGDAIGPGHAGFFVDTPRGEYMSYHYYNGSSRGRSELALRPVEWSDDGWPRMGKTSNDRAPSQPDGAGRKP